MSEWLVLSIAMAAACVVVLTIVLINNRRIGDDDDPTETPDVMEYMTMMIGVVYAIVLGLAIAGVWEGRGAAQESVRQEAQSLHEVQQRVQVYPPAVRDRIRGDVDAYVTTSWTPSGSHMSEHESVTDRGRPAARHGPPGRHPLRAEDRPRGPGLPAAGGPGRGRGRRQGRPRRRTREPPCPGSCGSASSPAPW